MKLQLQIESLSDNADKAKELDNWLRQEEIDDITNISQKRHTPERNEMGPELINILEIVLTAPAIIALIKSLNSWIAIQKRNTTVTIKNGDRSILINSESPRDQTKLVLKALEIFEKE